MSLENAKLINFPKIDDSRGSLSFIEGNRHIPFEIKRIYYLYNNNFDVKRGAHGHKKLEQIIIPISGSFNFILDDGFNQKSFFLESPHIGLYVPSMMWRDLNSFSPGSICLVLASDVYDEEDYYRNYQEFLDAVRK